MIKKKFRRFIIHAGLDKTGSTAIQSTMSRAKGILKNCGIIYPLGNWHAKLGSYFSRDPDSYIFNILDGRLDPYSRRSEDKVYLEEFIKEISCSTCHTVVVSYEGFGSLDYYSLKDFSLFAEHWAERVEVMAYCRHPYSYASSAASQRVQTGFEPWNPAPYIPFKDIFEKIGDAFGRNALRVINYDLCKTPDKDIIENFFSNLGLDKTIISQLRETTENSFPNSKITQYGLDIGQEFIRKYSKSHPPGKYFYSKFSNLLRSISGPKIIVPPETWNIIEELSRPHLEYIERNFGIQFIGDTIYKPSIGVGLPKETIDIITSVVDFFNIAGQQNFPRDDLEYDLLKIHRVHTEHLKATLGLPVRIHIDFETNDRIDDLVAGFFVTDRAGGRYVFGTNMELLGESPISIEAGKRTIEIEFVANLPIGLYTIGLGVSGSPNGERIDLAWRNNLFDIEISEPPVRFGVGPTELIASVKISDPKTH
jgi:hypothetical protein